MTHLWVVVTDDSIDSVYVFACEDDARAFAQTYGDFAYITEEPVIDRATAAEMIRQRSADWIDEEPE